MTTKITKTAAKAVNLPVGSATALVTWAGMAGDWSGTPMVNDTFGRSTGGYVAKLVAAGMVETWEDGGDAFVRFTNLGIDTALNLGASTHINEYRSAPVVKESLLESDMAAANTTDDPYVMPTFDITVGKAPVVEVTTPAVKVCKKDASHGEHRVTRTGSYCYACDRILAEAQKAARSAKK